ncbi:MAG TPA: hypothetical protein VJG90_03070 [Candidatus Nanoarchaeia archaeon]|nr:hypothetical protein [Candidatus Nanoarchaeia archaeon]
MTTTIAVQEGTLQLLKSVKEENHAESFDEVIRQLVWQSKKSRPSLRGIAKHTPEFVREEIDRFV